MRQRTLAEPLLLPIRHGQLALAHSDLTGEWQTSWSTWTETGHNSDLDETYQADVGRPGPMFLDAGLVRLITRLNSWAWDLAPVEAY